jgi:DNA-binding FadR family transcriptional regulator
VPLDPSGRLEVVERRLTRAIRIGLLGDGEQLPSQLELAGQLGVSTVTLRGALARQRATGACWRRGRAEAGQLHTRAVELGVVVV